MPGFTNYEPKFVAGGTIVPSQFVIVSTVADNTVLAATAGAATIGISQEGQKGAPGVSGSDAAVAATAGMGVMVFGFGDCCLLKSGSGGWAAGDFLKADSGGLGVTAGSGDWFGAIALEACTAGDLARVVVITGFNSGASGAGSFTSVTASTTLSVTGLSTLAGNASIAGSGKTLTFYGGSGVAQATRAGQLTDSTTGNANLTTIADVGTAFVQATLNSNFAGLISKVNKLETIVHNVGLSA